MAMNGVFHHSLLVPIEFSNEQVFSTMLNLGFNMETIHTDIFETQKHAL
jgi:hypothetical protein